ncbi:MAG TPA: hypothetical protein VER03_24165 [Bryobacteraceae bacterium]|nr:hypothetical protein [Bryobacteraceae bacterium]
MSFAVLAFAVAWKFVAPDASPVVAMEWKSVLNSPFSAEVRREILPAAVPALASINFIEGIERVVWTPGLVVLEGSFDVPHLRDMAVADGGAVTRHGNLELVGSAGNDGTAIALSPGIVLLGSKDVLRAAVDRSEKNKATNPGSTFALWSRTAGEGFVRHEFGIRLSETIQLSSTVRYTTEEAARKASENASAFKLTSSTRGAEASFSAALAPQDFAKRQWRVAIETLHSSARTPPASPGKIRIYGLDEGVKEIPLK